MNELQTYIRNRAALWAECWCCETRKDGGSCVDDLTARFTGGKSWRVAYCAMTAYVLYAEACGALGLRPLLPKTAGAALMLQQSRRHEVLKDFISDEPVIGAQFYRKSSATGSRNGSEISGHIGTVFDLTDDRMIAVEGNSGQQIRYVSYALDELRKPSRGFAFIHACLAPHEAAMRVTSVFRGLPLVVRDIREPTDPPACRQDPACRPRAKRA